MVEKLHLWTYEQAATYVQSLQLDGYESFKKWAASDQRPDYIPKWPHYTYRNAGWEGYPAFLGNQFWSYEQASAYVRELKLPSSGAFQRWAASDQRPAFIPTAPHTVYYGKGWIDMSTFLGLKKKKVRAKKADILPYEEARAFVKNQDFHSGPQYCRWASSGQRPPHMPSNPYEAYRNNGWQGWKHFLSKNA